MAMLIRICVIAMCFQYELPKAKREPIEACETMSGMKLRAAVPKVTRFSCCTFSPLCLFQAFVSS